MSWLHRFLGTKDKQQKERTDDISFYIHQRKNEFMNDMLRIQVQAKTIHRKAQQIQEESVRLQNIADDVAARIAKATGGVDR